MKTKILTAACWALILTGLSSSLFASVVSVPGTSNIFSAGQDANGGFPGGGTYAVLGVSFAAGSGQVITFGTGSGNLGITGSTNCGAGAPCNAPPIPADGSNLTFSVGANDGTNIPTSTVGTGISGIVFTGREMFLVGVFLSNAAPSGSGPFADNFTSASNQVNFAPLLGQVFFIGDGLTGTDGVNVGSGSTQTFQVPTNATRLFLGFADAFNNFSTSGGGSPGAYGDNTGSLSVNINTTGLQAIPEPGTIMLMGLGLVSLAFSRKLS
jgi:hypothetical protein